MHACVRRVRQMAKRIIAYEIRGEDKVYRLKHTPFFVKRRYTRAYHRELAALAVQPYKIVFDNYMGKGYGCNGKYVTEALLKKGRGLDIVWTVKDAKEQNAQFPDQVRLVEYGSREAMREYATAGVWAGNYHLVHYLNQGLLKKPGQTYIQMWHGSFGIKKIEGDCKNLTEDKNWTVLAQKNAQYTDYWISNSEFETDVYRQAFWNVDKTLEYGHPRNDIFFDERAKRAREAVEQYIGKSGVKLLLYVPTFRDDFADWEQPLDYGRLKQSLERRFGGEWRILQRLHPRMRECASVRTKAGGCVDVTEYADIQELLAAADAVITDYSSAAFDFLLTGRPAFVYASDYARYQKLRGLYYPLSETPFPIASDNDQMEERILNFDAAAYRNAVERFLQEKGSREDGGAAERVADLIVACMEQKCQ